MAIRILLLGTLFLASFGWGKDYEACKELQGDAKAVCENQEFSKERLIQGSEADQYAQRADGYRPPNGEVDSRAGSTLLSCDEQRNACVQSCKKGEWGCRESCLHTYTQCAGLASGSSSPGIVPAERPDGYTVEFNDEISKNQ